MVTDRKIVFDWQPVLILEGDRLDSDSVTAVEIVGSKRHVLSHCWHCIYNRRQKKSGDVTSHHLHDAVGAAAAVGYK